MRGVDAVLLHRGEHLRLIDLRARVDLREAGAERFEYFFAVGEDLPAHAEGLINFSRCHIKAPFSMYRETARRCT